MTSSVRCWLRVAFAFALLAVVYGAPIWEELFGLPPPRQPYYQQPQYYRNDPSYRAPRAGGKEKYKATCWVINADNYAFPGQSPYPSAPLCPYWSRASSHVTNSSFDITKSTLRLHYFIVLFPLLLTRRESRRFFAISFASDRVYSRYKHSAPRMFTRFS